MQNKPGRFIAMTAGILFTFSPVAAKNAKVQMYSDAQGKFSFTKAIKASVKGELKLAGKTSYKFITIRIENKGKQSAVNFLPSGSFDYKLLLPDKGKHKLTVFGSNSTSGSMAGLAAFEIVNNRALKRTDKRFNINKKIVNYIKPLIGKKIGRGECWDAAQEALDVLGARWQRTTGYGRPLNYKKDKIKPGDIIQFYKVTIKRKVKNGMVTESIGQPDHTAIVWEVLGTGKYKVAHQNVGGKRYMLVGDLDLTGSVTGKIDFYRPRGGLVK